VRRRRQLLRRHVEQMNNTHLDRLTRRLQREDSNDLLKSRDLHDDERVLETSASVTVARGRVGQTKTSASGHGSYSRQTSQEDVGLSERRHVDATATAARRHVLR